MQKSILILMTTLFAAGLFAQDEEETLLSGDITHGGFGGPVVKWTSVQKEFGVLVGGRGGWIINHAFSIGAGGYGLVNSIPPQDNVDFGNWFFSDPVLGMGYGGFEMEVIVRSDRLVHSTIILLIGAGGVGFHEAWDSDWEDRDDHYQWDSFFILEPGVNVELNVTGFFRLNVGASYRFVSGVDKWGLSESDIGGPATTLTFKFGKF
ncbi:hypothetical protein JW906_11320 [bacterium]|nr:hypothetical protein [bacterium]